MGMRVFIHRDAQNEYLSVNFAAAAQGFREMGWEIVGYQHISSSYATSINDREQIVGTCTFRGKPSGFLLTPISEK